MPRPLPADGDLPRWSSAQVIVPGVALALVVALHKLLNAAVPVNDDFMHLSYSRQLLAGEWPVRDFFDFGMGLMYGVSALSQLAFGDRLLSEAIVIAVMTGASAFLVYGLTRRASGSTTAAVVAALLLVVAAPRGYAYPKWIVYSVAAALWWRYVWTPGRGTAILLGVWMAVAYHWRPDHALYVAIGAACAYAAAHGPSRVWLIRSAQSGAVAAVLIAPVAIYSSVQTGGFSNFVRSGLIAAWEEHRSTGQAVPRWPLRGLSDIAGLDPAEPYAPVISVRWARDSSPQSRRDVVRRYALTVLSTSDPVSQRVRLSESSIRQLPALLAEPTVEDTNGVDRGTSRLPPTSWPPMDRLRFRQWWLRLRMFPGLDEQGRAGAAAAILLLALPILSLGAGFGWFGRHLPARVAPAHLRWFGLFALVVDLGLLRTPFHVRAGEAVVLPAVVLGLLAAALLRLARGSGGWRRWSACAAAAVLVLLVTKSLAVAGQSDERLRWLTDDYRSMSRAAWLDASGRLWSSPPIDHWRIRTPEITLRFAEYARDCLPESDRILALWFAPEIYYYSDRLMAGRNVFFISGFAALEFERELEMRKIRRTPPQMVFVKLDSQRPVQEAFPNLIEFIDREYRVAAVVNDGSEQYRILVGNDHAPLRPYGDSGWPCYR